MTEQRERGSRDEVTVASATSPYATGCGGFTFERRVATIKTNG